MSKFVLCGACYSRPKGKMPASEIRGNKGSPTPHLKSGEPMVPGSVSEQEQIYGQDAGFFLWYHNVQLSSFID